MKICVMTSSYKLSESDTNVPFLVESVRQLKASGMDVHVFAPSYEGGGSQVLDGVTVHRFRYFLRRWENLTHNQGAPNRLRNPLYLAVAAFYIVFGLVHAIALCRKQRFDLIHVHWPFPHGLWGLMAGWLTRAPVVFTFHGAELLLQKKYPFVTWFLRPALRHAAAVICNSRYTAGEVARLTARAVTVLPFGCTVNARPSYKDPHKPVKEILFTGRLVARKGLDVLLHALPAIAAQLPVHLHVVGDGDRADDWMALATALGLSEIVTFHGAVSATVLEQHYTSADVFVLPAIVDERGDTEGLGVVLIEALSFMTPVVASEVGGIPDVIQHERTGLLVPQKDPAALAAAVVKLLQDHALAAKLARSGWHHVQEHFNWERINAELLGIYRDAIGNYLESRVRSRAQPVAKIGARGIQGKILIAAVAVSALVALYVFVPAYWSPQSRAFAGKLGYPAVMRVLGRPIEVQAETVQLRTMVRVIAAEGLTAYLNEIPVHSEVPGIVTQILVEAGESIQRGRPLLYISPGAHTTRMFDLRRQLSQSERKQANLDLEREQRLYESNFTSKARLDGATASMQRAEIASRLAFEEYAHSLRSRSATVTGEPLPWAGTSVRDRRVVIAATMAGTVIERNVQLGENLVNLKEPLMVLGDQMVFRAEIDQRYAGMLREGAQGRFYLRARPGQPFPAQVLRVSHAVRSAEQRRAGDPPPFTFSVWMSIPSEHVRTGGLLPGMNGYAIFEQRYKAAALPERALTRYSGRTGTVLAVGNSNELRVEPVTYSGASEGWIAVESGGIGVGDLVVVNGQTALKEGDKVAVATSQPGTRELADSQAPGTESHFSPTVRTNLQ
ncbi:MAG: glycosyltransferase [Burkholderiales bacterium]